MTTACEKGETYNTTPKRFCFDHESLQKDLESFLFDFLTKISNIATILRKILTFTHE